MSVSDQKINHERYKVIPRTLIFLFNDRGQVLLIKGSSSKKLWPGLLNGIGGHIEDGEDIYEAAVRELEEETGLVEFPLIYCGQIMIAVEEDLGVGLFLFRGNYNGNRKFSSDEGKITWVSMDALQNVFVVEDLPILLPKIYQYRSGNPFIIGKYEYDKDGKLQIFLR